MKSTEFIVEVAKKKGQSAITKHKDDLSTTYKDHKAGDTVQVQHAPGQYRRAKVKRIGRTLVHVTHDDGTQAGYHPDDVGIRDKDGKAV